jgi:integrase
MASYSKSPQTTKDGRRFWKISVSRGYGKTPYTTRFYWPTKENGDPVAKSTAERELKNAVAEFSRACEAGEVESRAERKQREREEAAARAAEEAKIKTFRQYGEQVFMPAKAIECAEKTRRYYQNALDNHLYLRFGDMPLHEITSAALSAFFLEKQASMLSHSTVIGIYVTANQLFTRAYMDGVIEQNPLDRVKRPRQKKDDKHSDPPRFTEEEVKIIKKHLTKEPLKWQAFVMLLLGTGMRRGEACALTWDNINFVNMTIRIDGSLGYTPERGIYREKPKTEAGNRIVPLPDDVSAILQKYRAEQAASVARRKSRLEKEHKPIEIKRVCLPKYVFTVRGGSDPIYPDTVNRYFKRFGEAYNVEDFHPHKLRHTAASIMLEKGVPVVVVAAILGHDDPNVTHKTYAHASAEGMREGIDKLKDATKIG